MSPELLDTLHDDPRDHMRCAGDPGRSMAAAGALNAVESSATGKTRRGMLPGDAS
jgi:hypothetical protein